METIKYMVPKGTINRIRTANAIGVQELELKPVILIAALEGQFEIIHSKSIPGILMDLDAAQIGWIRWKEGNIPQSELSQHQQNIVKAFMSNGLIGTATAAQRAYEAQRQAELLQKVLGPQHSVQQNRSDTADALAFFNMLNSHSLNR